jgi:transcriptional regulator with XRE-family HTH domain
MAKNEALAWLDREAKRRGRVKEVEELFREMMVEEQLAELRRKRGISQRALAKLAGVSQPVIARMESGGVKNLTLATIARTAAALGGIVEIKIRPGRKDRERKSA